MLEANVQTITAKKKAFLVREYETMALTADQIAETCGISTRQVHDTYAQHVRAQQQALANSRRR